MSTVVLAGLALVMVPTAALACATCISFTGIFGYHAYFGAKHDSQITKETT